MRIIRNAQHVTGRKLHDVTSFPDRSPSGIRMLKINGYDHDLQSRVTVYWYTADVTMSEVTR